MNEESKAETSASENTIPEKREMVIKRPGFINWSDGKSNYPGSLLKGFFNVESLNEFFRQNANLLTVGMWFTKDGIYVLYTNMLEGEELEEFNEYSRAVSIHMAEWRRERAEAKLKSERRQSEAEAEVKRKLQIADQCEKNHAGLIEENRKLKSKKGK